MASKWKEVPGYEGIYEVSDKGIVRSVDRLCKSGRPAKGVIRATYSDKDGYKRVGLYRDGKGAQFGVHRLVASAFLPKEIGKIYVNHKNGIKDDNRLENLEWCTAKENSRHAVDTGLKPRSPNTYPGINHNTCKGIVIATNIKNGQQIKMAGVAEYVRNGFRADCVYKCLAGDTKSHKGHTFNRLNKGSDV